eukprot:scaffold1881_cov256-Pinguiococcus_pyrenoidosus.AAC.2
MGGFVPCLEWLWERHGEGVERFFSRVQKEGHTPLHKAAQKGRLLACNWLLQRLASGAEAKEVATGDSKAGGDGPDPKEHCEAEQEKSAGANACARLRPSDLASAAGHVEVAQLLQKNGR